MIALLTLCTSAWHKDVHHTATTRDVCWLLSGNVCRDSRLRAHLCLTINHSSIAVSNRVTIEAHPGWPFQCNAPDHAKLEVQVWFACVLNVPGME